MTTCVRHVRHRRPAAGVRRRGTVRELVAIVRTDLAAYADRLSAALAAGDYATLRETAHAIKGTVSNVSAGRAGIWRTASTAA